MKTKINTFAPYQTYLKNISQINDFEELTDISYALSQQLLFKYPKKDLPKFEHEINKHEALKKGSYSMADVTAKKNKTKMYMDYFAGICDKNKKDY